ncbi:Pimeloyl-ACP methyl ester carboxylesterase [Chitinophaga eiseniae]|uniref:Pimeloyl-ACP methyl ester carboxylesterase n=1 Tax=Chitinophaga eiseniae TaxID=634771 RepID=A0A1T4TZC2_9BACT|nr:alpha/beta hydrolase [Chitinophaga eiseniae]SKA45651.1 Pimeloyl-ACP methyl ester carboxylesterase [Chitinophaga eiseniae]
MNHLTKALLTVLMICSCFIPGKAQQPAAKGYAPVNGLKMYYETQGKGAPILLLHGAYMSIEGPFRELMDSLSRTRKVIIFESQGHARTADINRPITCEHMADDAAALLQYLKIDSADVFGYSMGGGTALQLAIRHPKKVKKLIVASASFKQSGMQPELIQMMPGFKAEYLEGTPMKMVYDSLAPNPKNFPVLVEKLKALDIEPQNWPASDISGIKSQTLLIFGDSDAIVAEHAVEMFRLIGGGKMGDMGPLPNKRLAILPGTTHMGVMMRPKKILPVIEDFLQQDIIPPGYL